MKKYPIIKKTLRSSLEVGFITAPVKSAREEPRQERMVFPGFDSGRASVKTFASRVTENRGKRF